MLARITYALVLAALGTLVGGFFQKSANTLLYISIGLSLLAIVLVVVGAARRAKEAPAEVEFEPAFEEGAAQPAQEVPAELLSAFEEEEEEEEVEVVPRPARRAPRPAGGKAARPGGRGGSAKVVVVPGRDRYHAPTCRFIQGKEGTEEVSAATARRRGYQPCSACKPG